MSQIVAEVPPLREVTLNDKWTVACGRILISGTQALARVLLAQHALDAKAGLSTAGYVSGYRGSPLGNVDTTLWSIKKQLAAANITFVPGVNEDIAATAVRGTQQLDFIPHPLHDGVFALWYGKGPGVDRSGDALKHGNYAGAHRHGGVLVCYGDDHFAKSSTVAHHSEQAIAAAMIPSLYPANPAEIITFGLLGFAMSRYSGSWIGMKLVNEVVEQSATINVNLDGVAPIRPAPPMTDLPREGVNSGRAAFNPLREEQIVHDFRLPLVHQFIRANGIDRVIIRGKDARLGIVTAGKSYGDVRQALSLLHLEEADCERLGLSLYKLGCIWPVEPQGLQAFASHLDLLMVVEEKAAFVEGQAAAILFNVPTRPRLLGKTDEANRSLFSTTQPIEPADIALAIAGRMRALGISDPGVDEATRRLQDLSLRAGPDQPAPPRRSPYFCSGCPHNRSTRTPEGSLSMTGIGCHTMVSFARPQMNLLPTQMGGEGANWIGLAPFTGTKHVFQNMGDGTYYHSGLLAIRAAVASRANITYKILYNDAVAMTGGQPVDGPISVAEIAQQVRHEGVEIIVVLSDNPDSHRSNSGFPPNVRIDHRDNLDTVQRELREVQGCSVLIYEQTCAAEKRRRRKRGTYPDPKRRLFISQAVCEGCGDCSVQSTCVSLTPVQTDLGIKRQIDQSGCNKDYSCLNGFCPSFVTVDGAEPRRPQSTDIPTALTEALREPSYVRLAERECNIMIAGIGGTGVVTVGALLGMAAHLDGFAASAFDMTGLAQKNGAVFSHLRLARSPQDLRTQRLGRGEADQLLAFDLVAAASPEVTSTLAAGRTRALVNTDVAPTVAFQFDRNAKVDQSLLLEHLRQRLGQMNVTSIDATSIATRLLGDSIATNLFVVGAAWQNGMIPVSSAAIEKAIELNNVAVPFNLAAFRLGRLFQQAPSKLAALLPTPTPAPDPSLSAYVERRIKQLEAYQSAAYAQRYVEMVERAKAAERRIAGARDALTRVVAETYARLLTYKDEYEVARLLTDPALESELRTTFEAGARFSYNLAPPILGGPLVNGRPRKRRFAMRMTRPLLRLLAKLRFLRGTRFDPFGFTDERRRERSLISEYEALVTSVLSQLSASNHAEACTLLGLASEIRGYGPIKATAIDNYRGSLPAAREAFERKSVAVAA
jgi:indolepyruvate ferredoxin oxidoreductase